MEIPRRKLLQGLPATTFTSGCIQRSTWDSTSPVGGEFVERTIEILGSDPVPGIEAVDDISANVLDGRVRESSTASVELTFTYGGVETRQLEFPFFTYGAVHPVPNVGPEPELLLYGSQDLERADHCWKRPTENELGGTGEMPGYTFRPGEQLAITSYVWADHRSADCFETGDYRFETELPVDGERLTWGFRTRVTDPETA